MSKDTQTLEKKVHAPFYAQDRDGMPVQVLGWHKDGETVMMVVVDEQDIYITKEQAKAFFGL